MKSELKTLTKMRRIHQLLHPATIYAIALLLLPTAVRAQFGFTSTFEFPNDVKYYSLEFAVDANATAPSEETIAAGTIFNYPSGGFNSPHVFVTDRTGNSMVSKAYDLSPNFQDVRAMSIVNEGYLSVVGPWPGLVPHLSRINYVTCVARPNGSNDRILILPVRLDGSTAVQPYTITSNNANEGLYPLHSVISNGSLYICGYVTDNNTGLPGEPGYVGLDHKKGFVIKINNPGTSTPTVAASITINTNCSGNPAPPYTSDHDFDIAMNMKVMLNGNIHVTGSVNNEIVTGGVTDLKSAIMNLLVDPNLSTVISDDHFSNTRPGGLRDEYGTATMEDGYNGNNYIVSNQFVHYGGHSAPYTTFDPTPTMMSVTYLDGLFKHIPTDPTTFTDNTFNSQWGLQLLQSTNPNTIPGHCFLFIAGMTTGQYCGATGASYSNVLPFTSIWYFGYTPGTGITGSLGLHTTYQTKTGIGGAGTGPYSAPNSYPMLGGGLSNWAWGPKFSTYPYDAYNFVAPRYTSSSLQGLKLIHARCFTSGCDQFDDPTCGPSSYINYYGGETCFEAYYYTPVQSIDNSVIKQYGTLNLSVNTVNPTITNYAITGSSNCVGGMPNYKTGTTGIKSVQSSDSTILYPNPASDHIQVNLDKNISSANVRVDLLNILGTKIATLYSGTSDDIATAKIMLPKTVNGLYIVQVNADNRVANFKLNIQQ